MTAFGLLIAGLGIGMLAGMFTTRHVFMKQFGGFLYLIRTHHGRQAELETCRLAVMAGVLPDVPMHVEYEDRFHQPPPQEEDFG